MIVGKTVASTSGNPQQLPSPRKLLQPSSLQIAEQSVLSGEAFVIIVRSIDDLEPHLSGSAGDDSEAGFVVAGVQVFALSVDDVHHLFATDLSDFGLIRLLRTGSDVRSFLEQNGRWRTLGDKRERLVLKDRNDDWENVAGLFLCGGVKFLAKRHDVDAA